MGSVWHTSHWTGVGVVVLYVALILGYPLFGDEDLNGAVFFVGWLGSSFLAGLCVPRDLMMLVPVLVGGVLLWVVLAGLSESEMLTDSLSSIAVVMLAGGEIIGIRFGIAAGPLIEARRGV